MANSKANIYPVQLQGAELNLNKYDAEIKPYSGFNKNNSPFVGGCLSNLFTKDETIEGANSRNTYIAPNGDVYRVTTEGLFKNDELLIDTSDKEFYNVEEVTSIPSNVVYVYDEDTYIYVKDQKLYYYSNGDEHEYLALYSDYRINSKIKCFNFVRRTISGTVYDIVVLNLQNSNYPRFYINIYQKNENGGIENVYTFYMTNTDEHMMEFQNSQIPAFAIKTNGDTLSDFKIAVLRKDNRYKNSRNYYDNFMLSFNGESIQLVSYLYTYYSDGTTVFNAGESGTFTDKYFQASLYGIAEYTSEFKAKCNYTVDFTNNKIIIDIDYASGNANTYGCYGHGENEKTYFQKPWSVACGLVVKRQSDDKLFFYSVDDEISSYPYFENNTVHLYIGCIVNDCVLINSGLVTGLSLPGGLQLVTEWNTVDNDYIFFGENTDEWKENKYIYIWKNINTNKWYKLVKSTPWIKVINNQVIINANTINNAFDIVKNKTLLFAPAWNNRRIVTAPNPNGATGGNYYIATAINEYKLSDNASLIINPVLSSIPFILASNYVYNIFDKEFVQVNCYSSANNDAEVLYRKTTTYLKDSTVELRNQDLIDLPFPSNTDGNIQYSPSLFAEQKGQYGNLIFISEGGTAYKLMTYDNKAIMSYFLSTAIEGLKDFFTIQGQLYGIINNHIYNFSIINEVVNKGDFIVDIKGLQFCGNTPYEALFFSKINRCLYSFTGANVMNSKQFVDKITQIINYKYNPATQSIFLITDIGVIVYSLFGIYQIDFIGCKDIYVLDDGVILTDNEGTFKFVKYYKEITDEGYEKQNIQIDTCYYGINNQTVTINDCLYFRIFSEEHESGDLQVSATTISLQGRMTETTSFHINANDWDAETNTIYLRYQPQEQRGLGISFKINSPFKIASLAVGSQADAILLDKVSKNAIVAPQVTPNNTEW